jgi:branched-chain amino acid transport system permease protein
MAEAAAAPGARALFAEIPEQSLREAAITFAVAFILFGSLVGFKTETVQTNLVLTTRFGAAFALALAVAIIRLLADLLIWRRGGLDRVLSGVTAGSHNAGKAALALFFLAGAAFFIVPGVSGDFSDLFADVFAFAPGWTEGVRTFAFTLSFLAMTVFVLLTAMAAARILRIAAGAIAGKPLPAGALTHNFASEFAPGLLLVGIALPFLIEGPQQRYAVDTATQVLIYVMLGWGLNIVVGLAGLLDLGYVAFYAVGAYTYALISTHFGWSFWICLPLAGLFAALWGVILGFPVLRLRGDYLAIVTLAFGEIVRIILLNWQSLTNGPNGIIAIPRPSFFGLSFDRSAEHSFSAAFGLEYNPIHRIIFLYYLILALALLTNFVTMRIRRLPMGRAWEALREDEIACRSLGINTTTTKLTAFAMGAMFGGFAGSFFATRQGFISPESFTFHESALVLAVVVLGGLGSQLGVVVAAVALIGSSEFFRDLEEYRMLVFGGAMVALMAWRPRGLITSRTPSVALKESRAISADLVKEGHG